jgi:hypothetical protein
MPFVSVLGNPAKSRGRRKARKASSKRRSTAHLTAYQFKPRKRRSPRANPIAARRRRPRRNPIGRAGGSVRRIVPMLKGAALGASGAIGNDSLFGLVGPMLPAAVQSPVSASGGVNPGYYAAKGATAIMAGLLLRRMIGAGRVQGLVDGALTVLVRDAARQFIVQSGVALPMGSRVNPALLVGTGGINRMGKYVSGPGATQGVPRLSMYVNPGSPQTALTRESVMR